MTDDPIVAAFQAVTQTALESDMALFELIKALMAKVEHLEKRVEMMAHLVYKDV